MNDLVGGARKLFELTTVGAVVHSAVIEYEGDFMVLGDHTKYVFCGDYEFAFVPTAALLAKILKYVGFSEVLTFQTLDRACEADLLGLTPVYDQMLRNHNAYFVAKKVVTHPLLSRGFLGGVINRWMTAGGKARSHPLLVGSTSPENAVEP